MSTKSITQILMKKVKAYNSETGELEDILIPLNSSLAGGGRITSADKIMNVKVCLVDKELTKPVDNDDYQLVARYLRARDQTTVYRKSIDGVLHIFHSGCGVKDIKSFDFFTEKARGGENALGEGKRRMPICEKCLRDMKSGARKRNAK